MSVLRVTLIQTALHWEDKEANLQMLQQKISAVKDKTHVVVLPEMFSTGFSMKPEVLAETMNGTTFHWMKEVAAKNKIILTGSIIIKELLLNNEGEQYFNRMVWMLPNGQNAYCDKRHLFAYAEEDKHYTAGSKRLITSVNGWKINLMVCYDLRFPVWSRQSPPLRPAMGPAGEAGRLEYDVLIYVANWPEKRSLAWKTLLQARAIENQCYVIGVNRVGNDSNNIYYSGDSMVIDSLGEILYHKAHDEDVFTITLDREHLQAARDKFPFWRDADSFKIFI
ncbi:MAG: nitrilase family protein [Chitinophagaceae bacterium]